MKKTILILFLCGTTLSLHAQTAVIMRQVQTYISNFNYKTAIALLEPAAKKKNVRPETLELLGDCYRALGDRKKAAYYYEKRIAKGDNHIPADVFFHYGEWLIYGGNYAAAKAHLRTYYNSTPTPNPLAQVFMASCDTAMAWMAQGDSSKIFAVGNFRRLNSKSNDWGAMYHNNGIMFISNRPYNKNDDDQYYAVYKSNYRRNILGAPQIFFSNIRNDTHLGPVVFTKNGKTIYYTQTNTDISYRDKTENGTIWENKLELKTATINNDKLSAIKSFKYNNPREYSVGHACLSPDDSVLYYVSDMPGGYGGTDIYYSVLEPGGEWSRPRNAGSAINTVGNEMFPTMDSDGVLYFSSNGSAGLGGLDIFRAKGEKDEWTITQNMRYPINSSGDDFFLLLSADKSAGFFTSNRPGGLGGDDIYTLTVTGTFPDFGYTKDPSTYTAPSTYISASTYTRIGSPTVEKEEPIKTEKENVIADNIIPDTEQEKGIEYRVQVMARKAYPDWAYLDKVKAAYPQLKILDEHSFDGFTRFTVGQYNTAKEATKLKNELRALGYTDAFVVMFVNGKRKVVSYN